MGHPEEPVQTPAEPIQRTRARRAILLVAFCGVAVWLCTTTTFDSVAADWFDIASSEPQVTTAACSSSDFAWDSIIPSETLEWTRCYHAPLECSRLVVPLNYEKPQGQKAVIALIRYPSKYPVGHDMFRGPILYNPGGPGGSGVAMVRGRGANFSQVIGDDYDHVGFDPRGLGFTTPSLQLFTSESEAKVFALSSPSSLNSSHDALARIWGASKLMGQLTEERSSASWVAQHMSTAFVARDMLSITRAYGREKLLYWGFSYGSVLGITFASMFPNNVDRLIVDGVVDTVNYYAGAWDNNLRDTDAGLGVVVEQCAASSTCPLYTGGRLNTVQAVSSRLERILSSLSREPLVAYNNATGNYGLVDGDTAKSLLFQMLYVPRIANTVFDALAAAEKGNGVPLLDLSGKRDALWRCGFGDNCGWTQPVGGTESAAAIACSDADVVRHDTLQDHADFYQRMGKLSRFAEFWVIHTFCAGWRVRSKERFNGPFVGNTSFPLLLIGNTYDPVTPLWAAKKMSKGFKDAAVLTQNSVGHCSLSAASLCTAKAIRAYFHEGALPKRGTVCETEDWIFKPDNATSVPQEVGALSDEDASLLEAMRGLSNAFEVPKFRRM